MARDRALEFVDRLHAIGPIAVTRFFGGAGLVKNGVQFAFVLKGSLYLRVNEQSRSDFKALGAAPFSYAACSRMVKAPSYYELPDEIADDHEALLRWMNKAWHAAVEAKLKPRRKVRKSGKVKNS